MIVLLVSALNKNLTKMQDTTVESNSSDTTPTNLRNSNNIEPPIVTPPPAFRDTIDTGLSRWRYLFYPSLQNQSLLSSQRTRRPHSYSGSAVNSFDGAGYLR